MRRDFVGGTEWFPTEPFIYRDDVCGSSATGVGAEGIISIYVCFVNLTKAYDSVDQTLLWRVLARFGVSHNMISFIRHFHNSMRAFVRLDDMVCSGWFTVKQGLHQWVRARAPPVQHLLRGGYKRGLHAFQDKQRHHGRFGAPEEEKGDGGAGASNCRRASPSDAVLGHVLR